MLSVEHYYVFPNGLHEGTYHFYTHWFFPGIGEKEDIGTLTVLSASNTP